MLADIHTFNARMQEMLDKRKEDSLYRSLQINEGLIDLCSNDYLSFARSENIRDKIQYYSSQWPHMTGSTGSRSISGNTSFAELLEEELAAFYLVQAGLIFNSGYDANIGLFSSIAKKGDIIICDELVHASIIDGCRLSYASRFRFAHNDVNDLEKKLQNTINIESCNIFIAVESVYSMDGDMSPLKEIVALCEKYGANLIVDEAHATGVFGSMGRGLVQHHGLEKQVFARVVTFGKAMGGHGAIVLGDTVLRNYLVNFARSFIFTTALPVHSLIAIKCAYEQLASPEFDNQYLYKLIEHFRNNFRAVQDIYLIDSISPVQSVVIPGSARARAISKQLQSEGFDVRAILSPSVPVGKERLRISLHLHNTLEEVNNLLQALNDILNS